MMDVQAVARRGHLADESGVALLVALMAMLVLGVITAAVVTMSVANNQRSVQNTNQKVALEAAEAGLQVALYRFNMLQPGAGDCVGNAVSAPASNGVCASPTYTLSGGSTYQYDTTPVLGPSSVCVGSTVSAAAGVSNICITATGTANGAVARSQIRAAAFSATPLFAYGGITGLGGIVNDNNVSIAGTEASNEGITANNGSVISGPLELGPQGSYNPQNHSSSPTKNTLSSPLVLSPVDPGTSATENDDYRISNYINNPSQPTAPYDQSSGVSFNPTTRAFTASNNASITLGGGVYNFCSFSASNNSTINLAPGVSTEIFIDSPEDTGSGCPAGSGTFVASNNVTWANPSDNPTALQIYIYGPDTGSNAVAFDNNGVFNGVLYAPTSDITVNNNAEFNGAIAGAFVTLDNNAEFTSSSQAQTLDATTQGLFYRTAWATCTATAPSSAPDSGCN